jgi:hypothetical protein
MPLTGTPSGLAPFCPDRLDLRHDHGMRVSVLSVSHHPVWKGPVAEFGTDFGSATVRWCGDPAAAPGEYPVEFTIDRDDLHWGCEVRPAEVQAPGVHAHDDQIVLRGLLEFDADEYAFLRLGTGLIQLGPIDALPATASGTWIDLVVNPADVALYPYDL